MTTLKFRVLGAHANRNFFDIEVEATDGMSAFGAAALVLREADEDGAAEFFAAIPAGTQPSPALPRNTGPAPWRT